MNMRRTKCGILNRNQIKYIAIIAMVIDHIAYAFIHDTNLAYLIMRFFGRITGPTMAYFLAEGYYYTRDIKRYVLRLGIFTLISWIPFSIFEYGMIIPRLGVIYTLLLGLIAIWIWDRGRCSSELKVSCLSGLCLLSYFGDWSVYNVSWCFTFYIFRDNIKLKWTAYCCICAVYCLRAFNHSPNTSIASVGVFTAPALIGLAYSGKSGSRKKIHKWFFYVFYPLHMIIISVMQSV